MISGFFSAEELIMRKYYAVFGKQRPQEKSKELFRLASHYYWKFYNFNSIKKKLFCGGFFFAFKSSKIFLIIESKNNPLDLTATRFIFE